MMKLTIQLICLPDIHNLHAETDYGYVRYGRIAVMCSGWISGSRRGIHPVQK